MVSYIQTNLGWVYLAAVLDLKNKEVIGYEIGKNIDSDLSMSALGNAIATRGRTQRADLSQRQRDSVQLKEVQSNA